MQAALTLQVNQRPTIVFSPLASTPLPSSWCLSQIPASILLYTPNSNNTLLQHELQFLQLFKLLHFIHFSTYRSFSSFRSFSSSISSSSFCPYNSSSPPVSLDHPAPPIFPGPLLPPEYRKTRNPIPKKVITTPFSVSQYMGGSKCVTNRDRMLFHVNCSPGALFAPLGPHLLPWGPICSPGALFAPLGPYLLGWPPGVRECTEAARINITGPRVIQTNNK